jgi:hypothetical protein
MKSERSSFNSSAQALGRGLGPRLSTGTLQLSILCSSVHFGPSLSLPVNPGREVSAEVAAAAGFRFPSSASAQDEKPMSNRSMRLSLLSGPI